MSDLKICTKCVLPETFPGIHFDDQGVCNHCRQYEAYDYSDEIKSKFREKFLTLIHDLQSRNASVDALVAYSGGKDSTYTLWLMKEVYGLRVEAFTYDNYFLSPRAEKNIKTVCETLDVPHKMVRFESGITKKLFSHASKNKMYSIKHMERASTICTLCSSVFKSVALAYVLENNIPMIAYGWSPGQAPMHSALTQSNPRFVKMSQKTASTPVYKVVGEEEGKQFFLKPEHFEVDAKLWPHNVHPLAWEHYNEEDIKKKIADLGWVEPRDVDSNSTNCMLNAWANEQHVKEYQFHPYVMELATMVRQGQMDREEAYEKIYASQNQRLIKFAKAELGLEE